MMGDTLDQGFQCLQTTTGGLQHEFSSVSCDALCDHVAAVLFQIMWQACCSRSCGRRALPDSGCWTSYNL